METKVEEMVRTQLLKAKAKLDAARLLFRDFEVNFNLPDYIGLGKMVSRGFGTIKKTNEKQEI